MICETEILRYQQESAQQKNELIQLTEALVLARSEANYYKNLHQRNVFIRDRIEAERDVQILELKKQHKKEKQQLLNELEQLKAKLRKREQQLFSKKSEKKNKGERKKGRGNKSRGQEKGTKGHGRRKDFSNLQSKEEKIDLKEEEKVCAHCSCSYKDMNTTEDSEVIEVEVKAHVRKIRRKRYLRGCTCKNSPVIKTAPPEKKLIPKSPYGVSVWVHFLVEKYWLGIPLNRTLQDLKSIGVYIPPSSIVGGFQYLERFLRPINDLIVEKNITEKCWNADETRWEVFEELEGKGNYRWYLWVFRAAKSTVFILEPSRGTKVIKGHLGEDNSGIIGCDRYSAYKCFANISNGEIVLAFCWAHARRDFLDIAKKYPKHENWAMSWVGRIGELYVYNSDRLKEQRGTKEFEKADQVLRQKIQAFKTCVDEARKDKNISEPCQHVLGSVENHWKGLTTFVDHPQVDMDNNSAERALRGPVVGRKNYYGSGSAKMASFAAMMFTIIYTLLENAINPRAWLTWFFNECTSNKEATFENLEKFLPWNFNEEQKKSLKLDRDPPPVQDTS